MDIQEIPLDRLRIGQRQRALKPTTVSEIALSVSAVGLQSPIIARPLPDGTLEVIAGAHRLAAYQQLAEAFPHQPGYQPRIPRLASWM